MKGILFTTLLFVVEARHSPEFLQQAIHASQTESKGAYTATGTYPACEMAARLETLSKQMEMEPPRLLTIFDGYLFERFATGFSAHFGETAALSRQTLAATPISVIAFTPNKTAS